MRKLIFFIIIIMVLSIAILSTNILSCSAEKALINIPISNYSFEQEAIGDYNDLSFDESNPYADQGYVVPGWSLYKAFQAVPGERLIYSDELTFDGKAGANDGNRLLNIIHKSSSTIYYWSDPIDVIEGVEYTLSHDLYSEPGGPMYIGLIFYNEDGLLIRDQQGSITYHQDIPANRTTSYFTKWITINVSADSAYKWTTFSGNIVAPSTAVAARICFARLASTQINTSIDNVQLSYEGLAKDVSQPSFTGSFSPNSIIDISVTVSNVFNEEMPVMMVGTVYDEQYRLYNVNGASNFPDITSSGKINLSLQVPEDISDKHIEVMVMDISNGRIKPYYDTVCFPE